MKWFERNKKIRRHFCLHTIIIIFVVAAVIFAAGITHARESTVKIGVLAKRGPERRLAQWSPTAEYPTATIPGQTFVILPVNFEKISSLVESG